MGSTKKKNPVGVTDEMFVELNCEPFVQKIATNDLELQKKYLINSFRMVNTAFGPSLATVLTVNEEPRLYFLPDHVKNKAASLVAALQYTKEVIPTKDKYLVFLGKSKIDDDKQINNYIFTD